MPLVIVSIDAVETSHRGEKGFVDGPPKRIDARNIPSVVRQRFDPCTVAFPEGLRQLGENISRVKLSSHKAYMEKCTPESHNSLQSKCS